MTTFSAKIILRDKELGKTLLRALLPEASSQPEGKMIVMFKDDVLVINMYSSKFSTLRAMITSHIRMLCTAIELLKRLGKS
ncbi:MAG: hypothetical protein J7J99_08355 [Thermoprotei archaeon]|nr:hypothetical protein [Thermoprotei archaeon]